MPTDLTIFEQELYVPREIVAEMLPEGEHAFSLITSEDGFSQIPARFVEKAKKELDNTSKEEGEKTAFDLGSKLDVIKLNERFSVRHRESKS